MAHDHKQTARACTRVRVYLVWFKVVADESCRLDNVSVVACKGEEGMEL